MKQHLMIDLETMGLRPNAAILSIGVAHFDGDQILDTFHTPVSLRSCLSAGLTTDESTRKWWEAQSEAARSSWDVPNPPELLDALTMFNDFVRSKGGEKDICPWGNGADFDLVILKSAYDAIDAGLPWRFYNQHCFRTVKNLFQVNDGPRHGTYHNAVDDAVHQVKHLHTIMAVHEWRLPQ